MYHVFAQFLSTTRLRDTKKLIRWAMLKSLSLMERDIPKTITVNSMMNRLTLMYATTVIKLNDFAPLINIE